jgi:hypothetical protein
MAALRPSSPVVYPFAPCGMPGPRFVVHDTGPTEAPSPRALDRLRPTVVATHSSRRPAQADRRSQSATMRTRLHLKPGQKGTKHLLAQYGDSLVCVRYRYDAQRKKRFKTVELIVAQRDWNPPAPRVADDALVAVRVGFAEVEMRQQVKQAGGRWNPSRKVWELRYARVVALKLEARIVEEEASDPGCRR